MAIDIISDIGADGANSLISVDYMENYCNGRLVGGIWKGTDAQLPALVEATNDFKVMRWLGRKVDALQPLPWPRINVPDPDVGQRYVAELTEPVIGLAGLINYGVQDLDSATIPWRAADGCAELALQYLLGARTDFKRSADERGVIEKTYGPVTTRWSADGNRPTGVNQFSHVWRCIGPLLDVAQGARRLVMR